MLSPGIATEMSVWDGVVVSALNKAYEKLAEKPDDLEGDHMDTEDLEGVKMEGAE